MAKVNIGLWLDDLGIGLKDGLRLAASWHVEAIGLDAFGPELDPRALSASGRRELARLVRNTGASPTAVRADVGGRRLADPATLDVALGRIRHAFELARDLGVLRVVVPLGYVPPANDGGHERTHASLREALYGLASLSQESGVRPAALAGGEPPADLQAILNSVDSAGLIEVDLNPGALLARGEDPLEGLNVFSGRLGQATAADHYRGGSEAPFGKGDVPWSELLVALSTLSQPLALLTGCSRECNRTQALHTSLQSLKQLRSNPFS